MGTMFDESDLKVKQSRVEFNHNSIAYFDRVTAFEAL